MKDIILNTIRDNKRDVFVHMLLSSSVFYGLFIGPEIADHLFSYVYIFIASIYFFMEIKFFCCIYEISYVKFYQEKLNVLYDRLKKEKSDLEKDKILQDVRFVINKLEKVINEK